MIKQSNRTRKLPKEFLQNPVNRLSPERRYTWMKQISPNIIEFYLVTKRTRKRVFFSKSDGSVKRPTLGESIGKAAEID